MTIILIPVGAHNEPENRAGSRDISDLVAVNNGLPNTGEWSTVLFVDLNKDQYLDIVGATWWPNNGAAAYVSNNGNSWTSASTGLPSTGHYGLGDVGDINEDTNMDFIIPYEHSQSNGAENGIEVWLSNGGMGGVSWTHGNDPINTGGWTGVSLGDVDNDGHLDLAATLQSAPGGIRFWKGDGGTTWTNKSIGLPMTGFFNGIKLVDLNKDGRLDILTTPASAGFAVYTCNPDLSWTANSTGLNKPYNVWEVDALDINKDGNMDFSGGTDRNGVKVFLGNGGNGGSFQWTDASAGLPADIDYAAVPLGFVDRDDNPDLLTGEDNAGQGAKLYLGNGGAGGSMTWTRAGQGKLPGNVAVISADIGDFNGDGTGDLLLGKGYSWTGIVCYKTISLLSQLPLANAGEDKTVYVNTLVKLNGTLSSDDTKISLFDWNISSKPQGATVTLSDEANMTPTFTPTVAGDYIFSLRVKDEHNQWSLLEDTVKITAQIFPNARPQANAGADQTVKIFTLVQLNGRASWDDAQVTAYNWNFTSKPTESTANLSDETVVDPTFTPDFIGLYKFTLTVKDVNNTWSKNDEVVITVNPQGSAPPTADAGPDQTIELGDKAMLNGSASKDDQQIKTYEWTLESAPPGVNLALQNIKEQEVAPPAVGIFVFTLRVRDNDNIWSPTSDSVTITVLPKDLDPVPKITSPDDKDTFLSTDMIAFDGKESSDPEGGELTYRWTSDTDGEIGVTETFLHNLSVGEHTITLTVKDDHGHEVSTSIDIQVDLDDLPSAKVKASKTLVLKNEKVTFDGAESSDAQGSIAFYLFDYGDAQNSGWIAGSTASHIYKYAGIFNATLKVKDGKGQESLLSEPVQIVVGERPNAVLVIDLTVQTANRPIVIDATGSNDPDGAVKEYYFDLGDGTNTGWTSGGNKTIIYKNPGTYEISVKVRDNHGFESINTTKVTVVIKAPKRPTNGLSSLMLPLLALVIVIIVVVLVVAMIMKKRGKKASPATPAPGTVNAVQPAPPASGAPPPPPNYYAQQSAPQEVQQPQPYQPQQFYGQDQGQSYDQSYYQGYDQTGQQYQQPPQNPPQ